jgi:uncharacterized DUF497 family protein
MEFEWDETKNKTNIEKHGIDFNDAKEVFNDQNRKTSPDLRKDYGEKRYITVGKIFKALITVVFTFRGIVTRIISARISNTKEREKYLNQ